MPRNSSLRLAQEPEVATTPMVSPRCRRRGLRGAGEANEESEMGFMASIIDHDAVDGKTGSVPSLAFGSQARRLLSCRERAQALNLEA